MIKRKVYVDASLKDNNLTIGYYEQRTKAKYGKTIKYNKKVDTSTNAEFIAICFALYYASKLYGGEIHIYTDNQTLNKKFNAIINYLNSEFIITSKLQKIAIYWVPREQNSVADRLSHSEYPESIEENKYFLGNITELQKIDLNEFEEMMQLLLEKLEQKTPKYQFHNKKLILSKQEHLKHYKKYKITKDLSLIYFYTFDDNPKLEKKWILKSKSKNSFSVLNDDVNELLNDLSKYKEIRKMYKNGKYEKLIIKSNGKIKIKN